MKTSDFLRGLMISLLVFSGRWMIGGNYSVLGFEFLSKILPGGFLGLVVYCLYLMVFVSLIYFLIVKNIKESLFFGMGVGLGFIVFLSVGIFSLRNLVGGL